MDLLSVYDWPDRHELLYRLLQERDEDMNISHKAMPSWERHIEFVASQPYEAWYFIGKGTMVGACYLTRQNEIGVQILKGFQGRGYGPEAISHLMWLHGPRRYLANINPRNERSAQMFERLGFRLLQNVYSRDAE